MHRKGRTDLRVREGSTCAILIFRGSMRFILLFPLLSLFCLDSSRAFKSELRRVRVCFPISKKFSNESDAEDLASEKWHGEAQTSHGSVEFRNYTTTIRFSKSVKWAQVAVLDTFSDLFCMMFASLLPWKLYYTHTLPCTIRNPDMNPFILKLIKRGGERFILEFLRESLVESRILLASRIICLFVLWV